MFHRSPWTSRWAHWLSYKGGASGGVLLFSSLTCFEAFYTAFQSTVDLSISLFICYLSPVLCPSGSSMCYLTGKVRQVESLLSVFTSVAVGFPVRSEAGLYCEAELRPLAWASSEKQSRWCWAACLPHRSSSARPWLWQMLSAALDKTSPFLEFHISVNENTGGFVLLWILEG